MENTEGKTGRVIDKTRSDEEEQKNREKPEEDKKHYKKSRSGVMRDLKNKGRKGGV